MTIGLIVEIALRILRRHWPTLLALALLFAGPGALLTAAAGIRFNDVALDVFPGLDESLLEDAPLLTAAEFQRLGEALLAYLAATMVAGLLGSIGAVAFSALVVADHRARRPDLREVMLASLRRAPSVIVFVLVTTAVVIGIVLVAIAAMSVVLSLFSSGSIQRGGPGVFMTLVIAVALVVGVAYLTMRWALAFPVMAMEEAGWRRALVRSWRLADENVWRIFVVVLFGTLATVFVAALISQLLAVVIVDVLAASVGLDTTVAESVVIALGTVLLAPLSPVLLAVLAVDLRARRSDPGETEMAESVERDGNARDDEGTS